MGRLWLIWLVAVAIMHGGCDSSPRRGQAIAKAFPGNSREALESADTFEVISLNPDLLAEGKDQFYGHVVLGRHSVTDRALRGEIISALYAGIAAGASPLSCFEPRHGIRAVRAETTIDIVICFECSQADVYVAGKRNHAVTSDAAKDILDKTLRAAGIPLAESNLKAP